MQPKAKNLILDLLAATDGQALDVQDVIAACRVFGLTENNARVTLARLSADGLIEMQGRGSYQLAPRAKTLAGEVALWRHAEQRLRPWSGQWLAVYTAAMGRSDRAALRSRQRALDMLGFREWQRGLFLRPDNIDKDIAGVRQRLQALGLEKASPVFATGEWSIEDEAGIRRLWNVAELNQRYRDLARELDAWLKRADSLDPEEAARQSFLMGGRAIRQVVFDPWLPSPMIDEAARKAFLDCVRRYDAAGRVIWQRMFERLPLRESAPEIQLAECL